MLSFCAQSWCLVCALQVEKLSSMDRDEMGQKSKEEGHVVTIRGAGTAVSSLLVQQLCFHGRALAAPHACANKHNDVAGAARAWNVSC